MVTIHTVLKVRVGHFFATGLKVGLAQKPLLELWSIGTRDRPALGHHFLSLGLKKTTLPAPGWWWGSLYVHTDAIF